MSEPSNSCGCTATNTCAEHESLVLPYPPSRRLVPAAVESLRSDLARERAAREQAEARAAGLEAALRAASDALSEAEQALADTDEAPAAVRACSEAFDAAAAALSNPASALAARVAAPEFHAQVAEARARLDLADARRKGALAMWEACAAAAMALLEDYDDLPGDPMRAIELAEAAIRAVPLPEDPTATLPGDEPGRTPT